MLSLKQITYNSIESTRRSPRWWILALVQIAAFSVMGEMGRPHWLHFLFVSTLLISILILGPITAWLWLEIEASGLKLPKELSIKSFTKSCFNAAAIIFCSVMLVLLIRFVDRDWIFLAIISSLIAANAALAMLYAVLLGESFSKSLALAADTWNKKASLGAASALVLIVAHGVSYAIVHGLLGNFSLMYGFSVFKHSATIWILLLVLIFFAAIIGAFLNCFLVLLFLETIRRGKNPEVLKAEATKLEPLKVGH